MLLFDFVSSYKCSCPPTNLKLLRYGNFIQFSGGGIFRSDFICFYASPHIGIPCFIALLEMDSTSGENAVNIVEMIWDLECYINVVDKVTAGC
jgi:hypothetical protein